MTEASTSLSQIWKNVLPFGVEVSAGALSLNSAQLTPPELASVDVLTSVREDELKSGRAYAKCALSRLGVFDEDLPMGSDRSPVWPVGFIGSITHVRKNSEGFCAAAVARLDQFLALGIDIEYAAGLAPWVWATILTTGELDQVRSLPANEREAEVIRRWCVKEALAKATRNPIDPLAMLTQQSPFDRDLYSFTVPSGGHHGWHARTASWNDLILAAVAIPAQ
jgi:4'-phosphopantetheinyl transferase EntD